jgi:hypothetical protein
VDFLADRVVLFAELEKLAQAALEQLQLLAQRDRLALGERDRAPAVRVRHADGLEEVGMLVEELRVGAQVAGDVVGVHLVLIVLSALRIR